MLTITTNVVFLLPNNREYLFPALGTVQKYVAEHTIRMASQDGNTHIKDKEYKVNYRLDGNAEDLAFFEKAGMQLPLTEEVAYPDSIVDMQEDRIAQFLGKSKKHVADVCAIMSGCSATLFPLMNVTEPRKDMTRLVSLNQPWFGYPEITGEDLLTAMPGQYSGVIGYQGWETYLASAMGLPVIEILPTGRSRYSLSKWFNKGYRLLIEEDGNLFGQYQQAFLDLERQQRQAKAA